MNKKVYSYRSGRRPSGAVMVLVSPHSRLIAALVCAALVFALFLAFNIAVTFDFWGCHKFSNCPCIVDEKIGQESIKRYKPLGKSERELVTLLGQPDYPGVREDDERVDEIWHFTKPRLLLWIKNHRCIKAYTLITVWH